MMNWNEVNEMRKYKSIHRYILFVFIVIITILTFKEIDNNLCISVIGDEFGYWSAAAFLLDKPWHSVAATNNYYGWGYGIWLAPIMAIFCSEPSLMYQVAIMLNGFFICLSLLLAYKCTLCFLTSKNKLICALVAGIVTIYPSSFFGIYNTMTESLMTLIGWIFLWLTIQLAEKKNQILIYSFLLIVIAGYAYGVHQRTIGIVPVIILIICLQNLQNGNMSLKKWLLLLCAMVGTVLVTFLVKNSYKDWLYSSENIMSSVANDFSSVTSNVKNYFSLHAFKQVTISIIGKVYYFASATFLFGVVGVFSCIKSIWRKKIAEISIIDVFLLLSIIQAILISALFMPTGFEMRTDILIYGRYIEYCTLPLMLVGLTRIIEKKCSSKAILIIIISYILVSFIVSNNIATQSINTNMGNIFSIADAFCIKGLDNNVAVLFICMRAILIFLIIVIPAYTSNSRRYIKYVALLFILFYNINIFITVYEGNIRPWQKSVNDNVNVVEMYKQQNGEVLHVYDGGVGTKMIQFLLPNEECIRIDNVDLLEDNTLVLSKYSKENEDELSKQHEIIYKNSIVILWRK